jgi:hypothetical protein
MNLGQRSTPFGTQLLGESVRESIQDITKRILTDKSRAGRIPLKSYATGDLVVASAYRISDSFVVNVNENIWGISKDPTISVTYKSADDVVNAGWEID